jgi:hypothetical protein
MMNDPYNILIDKRTIDDQKANGVDPQKNRLVLPNPN